MLPLLTEQVPGLFTTSRGIMGYGVSTGAAGGMSLRGIGGSPTAGLLVLIDGHPQYMGLMGHPIADAYQSMLASGNYDLINNIISSYLRTVFSVFCHSRNGQQTTE